MKHNPWTLLGSETKYENPWIRVREDKVLRPDGQPGIYGVVEIPPSVAVLALDDRERIVLVGQWRYTRDRFSWEVPLGGAHAHETDMRAVAERELREETGVVAKNWECLGVIQACIGVTTDTQTIYLATGLTPHASEPDPGEVLEVRWMPLVDAARAVVDGEICECASMAAILKLHAMRVIMKELR
jgi:8-oxo-dGTP pyrophosphatase MutT (NUDIX family)